MLLYMEMSCSYVGFYQTLLRMNAFQIAMFHCSMRFRLSCRSMRRVCGGFQGMKK